MKVFIYIVSIILLIILFLFVFPIIKNMVREKYSIGHIIDIEEWNKRILYICKKWLNNTPVVPVNDNYFCSFFNKKESIQTWQKSSIYIALSQYNVSRNKEYSNRIRKFEKSIGDEKIVSSDFGMLAFGLLRNNTNISFCNSMINYLKNNCSENGIIYYKSNCKDMCYVDTLGMVCPFLTIYGIKTNNGELIELAKKQLVNYCAYGVEPILKLPYHAYISESGIKLGICDWARGLAWMLIGFMDSYICLLEANINDMFYRTNIEYYADLLLKLQQKSGGFTWQLLNNNVRTDSSATAVFGWYLAKCSMLFKNRKYLNHAIMCRDFIMQHTCRNGEVEHCQGDTIGIGNYSRNFSILPFAQGFTLRMQLEIENAEKRKY